MVRAVGEEQLAPLQHPAPLWQQVSERIEELIVRGELAPGTHLVELDLAARLGVSRNPVREALHGLARAGWVELRPRQGAFVRVPTTAEMDGFFDVRTALEVEAARAAATRCTPRDGATLRARLQEGEQMLAAQADGQALVEANSRLHAAITAVAANPVLTELLTTLDRRLRWYFGPVASRRAADSWREHAMLVDTIVAGDVERASATMRSHCRATAEAAHDQLPRP